MATTTTMTTTYAGQFAGEYISAALLSGATIENGGITVKPNIKFKETLKTVSTNDIVTDADCDFVGTSTITLAERVLQPEYQQVNLQLCKKDFQDDWDAIQMGYSAFDTLPSSFSDFLIGHVASKVAQRTETNIWEGDGTTSGQFSGLTTLLDADAAHTGGSKIAGSAAIGAAATVITELGSIVDAINSNVYGNEDLNIYISQNIARAYVRALGGFGAAGLGAAGTNSMGTQWWNNGSLTFDGVKLFVANGLADNTAVAAEKSNLYFGTGLLSDHNEVKVIDMADIDGSQNVRVVMRFTAGVQYGIVGDIVSYGI